MSVNDRRLIEDYIPIKQISAEASREKSLRHGHISTLHLWWARRPLVACRAAIYASLVPAPTTPQERATKAKFMIDLCKWKVSDQTIKTARRHIMAAHAVRLGMAPEQDLKPMMEGKKPVPEGVPPPKVLDPFAGGGSIPLEALRLGCDAYAMDLNPVAYLILLCTCVYPQKYGQPDPTKCGMTGPAGEDGNPTWGGLAKEVEYWGKWVIEHVREEIRDLYPPIPDPENPPEELVPDKQTRMTGTGFPDDAQPQLRATEGWLTPVAYLWTRTAKCPNPSCTGTVPLLRQTWLCRKNNRKVALRVTPDHETMRVYFEVVEGDEIDFDPAAFSRKGTSTCAFCTAAATPAYVQEEGKANRIGHQLMAIVCTRPGIAGKTYLAGWGYEAYVPSEASAEGRLAQVTEETALTVPREPIDPARPSPNARGVSGVTRYGIATWGQLFTRRQLLALMTFVEWGLRAGDAMRSSGLPEEQLRASRTYLGLLVDRIADYCSTLCSWHNTREVIGHTYARQALPMVWDFAETNPLGDGSGNATAALAWITGAISAAATDASAAHISRGSATGLQYADTSFDAVVTDPPYYDNVPYADLSDFFYVWLKRSIADLHPEHLTSELAPKRQEAIAASSRHSGDWEGARCAYERMMQQSFHEARRTSKQAAPMICVYAHKTTAGWSTLVAAMRDAGYVVTEAWPIHTEMAARVRATGTASLASSIFLVARRREGNAAGDYVADVRPQLERIVRERVKILMGQGVAGSDLVIACVGAGLRAYTQYVRVELPNGEELEAGRYLDEVQREVLETVLAQVMQCDRQGVGGVDKPTQYYVMGRYQYGEAVVDFDEANVLARGVGVELDAPNGLTHGRLALVEKRKNKVRLRNYRDRGGEEALGPRGENRQAAPLIDVLHRLLWLLEHEAIGMKDFMLQAQPNAEQLRIVAQSLAGRTLAAEPTPGAMVDARTDEQRAIDRLLASWKRVVEDSLFTR